MADTLKLELVSPERLLVSEDVEMVTVPGTEGEFGVLPQHAPTLSTLRPGFVAVYKNNVVTERFFVTGGFAEVTRESCTILVDEAIPEAAVTAAFISDRLARARAAVDAAAGEEERNKAEAAVAAAEAMARLAA